MSRAHLWEPDDGAGGERSVSQHPNFVTADGLAHIELQLARAQDRQDAAEAAGDEAAAERLDRDVRYWVTRRATAQVVAAPTDAGRVHFGSAIEVEAEGGARQTWRIVGEDEADPKAGSISWVSPLAQAMLGKAPGDVATVAGSEVELVEVG
jgi:transcription elongation GreA/GreB family factor